MPTRGVFGLAIHRAPHSGHVATAAAHVRVHLITLARIEPSSVLNASSCRKHRAAARWQDHCEAAVAVDAVWTSRSPLSRVGATERRSRDHGSHHTDDSQQAADLCQRSVPILLARCVSIWLISVTNGLLTKCAMRRRRLGPQFWFLTRLFAAIALSGLC